jgi:hypothetical protein
MPSIVCASVAPVRADHSREIDIKVSLRRTARVTALVSVPAVGVGAAFPAGITVSDSTRARGTGEPSSIGVERMTSGVAAAEPAPPADVDSVDGD